MRHDEPNEIRRLGVALEVGPQRLLIGDKDELREAGNARSRRRSEDGRDDPPEDVLLRVHVEHGVVENDAYSVVRTDDHRPFYFLYAAESFETDDAVVLVLVIH